MRWIRWTISSSILSIHFSLSCSKSSSVSTTQRNFILTEIELGPTPPQLVCIFNYISYSARFIFQKNSLNTLPVFAGLGLPYQILFSCNWPSGCPLLQKYSRVYFRKCKIAAFNKSFQFIWHNFYTSFLQAPACRAGPHGKLILCLLLCEIISRSLIGGKIVMSCNVARHHMT